MWGGGRCGPTWEQDFLYICFLLTARRGLGVTSTSRRVQRVRSTRQLARLSTDVERGVSCRVWTTVVVNGRHHPTDHGKPHGLRGMQLSAWVLLGGRLVHRGYWRDTA